MVSRNYGAYTRRAEEIHPVFFSKFFWFLMLIYGHRGNKTTSRTM